MIDWWEGDCTEENSIEYADPSTFTKLRVCVTGGRNYNDREKIFQELYALCGDISEAAPFGTVVLTIIHGGCGSDSNETYTFKGADGWAQDWAVINWASFEVYRVLKADWDRWGKAAGPMRNSRMLMEGKPDIVLAFPGGSGTANCVKQARQMGIKVKEIRG